MQDPHIAGLLDAWQSARWELEVRSRLVDQEVLEASAGRTALPLALCEDYARMNSAVGRRYRRLLRALRQRAERRQP